jgi:hypothetical protein
MSRLCRLRLVTSMCFRDDVRPLNLKSWKKQYRVIDYRLAIALARAESSMKP